MDGWMGLRGIRCKWKGREGKGREGEELFSMAKWLGYLVSR